LTQDALGVLRSTRSTCSYMKRTTAKTATPAAVARMPAAEAANFDWSTARPASFPNLQPSSQTISLRMPLWILHKLKTRANQRGVPYQAHLKEILTDSLRD
jgi:predicted DNA binding CopG/RHH family protein